MASFRNLAIGTLKLLGADNVAKTTRAIHHEPEHALTILGITNNPRTEELEEALPSTAPAPAGSNNSATDSPPERITQQSHHDDQPKDHPTRLANVTVPIQGLFKDGIPDCACSRRSRRCSP